MPNKRRITRGFTLVELLIVVALLGALATIMLPSFKVKKKTSFANIMQSEMREIQLAFMRFDNDCMLNTSDLNELTNIYFAPLFDQCITNASANVCFSCQDYDVDQARGWAGPYALSEGQLTVTNSSAQAFVVNAFFDPYGNPYQIIKETNKYYIVSMTNADMSEPLKRQLTFE